MQIRNPLMKNQAIPMFSQAKERINPDKIRSPRISQQEFIPEYKTDFSTAVRDIQKIFDVLAASPDCRTSKVEALKQAIELGQYDISGEALARKILLKATRV